MKNRKKTMIVLLFAIMAITGLTACQPWNWFIHDVLGIERKEDLGPQRELRAWVIGEGGSAAPLFATGSDGNVVNFFVNKKFGYDYDSVIINEVGYLLDIPVGNVFQITVEGANYNIGFKFRKNMSWFFIQNRWRLDALVDQQPDGTWKTIPQWGVPGRRQQIYTYYSTGKSQIVNEKGEDFGGPQDWIVDESVKPALLVIGNGPIKSVVEIEKIDGTSLVVVGKVKSDDPLIPPTIEKLVFSNISIK